MSHPAFPFIGAGEASYFEWAEMFVCFARAPTKPEAAAIAKGVPPPLRDTIAWTGPLLWVASEQGVGRLIAAAYKKPPAKPTKLTAQSKFKMAPASADARFNADIEAWLAAAHAKLPILVALRREDHEAGGTRLSDWHRDSLAALPAVIAKLAVEDRAELAQLGERLVSAAKDAKQVVAPEVEARFARIVDEAEQAEQAERAGAWDAKAAAAAKALGAPERHYAMMRVDLAPGLAKLAKVLPATAKRLQRLGATGLTLRPGAKAAAIAAAEKALGTKLHKAHRALLEAFDGGQLHDITVLGTAGGGAKGDAELATFTSAWCGEEPHYVIVAHTGRDNVIAIPRDAKDSAVYLLMGTPGWGGGSITRKCKSLDLALDLAIKAEEVWNNLAT